jgi:carbamoyltransferase
MRVDPFVLGINASHNGSVCLLEGDRVVVAIQEERLCRRKRARIFGAKSSLALPYCLATAGIEPQALGAVGVSVQGYASAPEQQVSANPDLQGKVEKSLHVSHHRAHAVSAFVSSGFEEAAVLVVDGVGSPVVDLEADERRACPSAARNDWETLSLYHATRRGIVPLEKVTVADGQWLIRRPPGMPRFGSLGGMFSAVAVQMFGDAMEAGKVMGLAPYGRVTIPAEDFFVLGKDTIQFHNTVPERYLDHLRWPNSSGHYEDLAASVQNALEVALLYFAGRLRARTGCDNLCFAGGVALNSVANERLLRESGFARLHIPPAAEDSGVAIGAAYEALRDLTQAYPISRVRHDAVGRMYGSAQVQEAVSAIPAVDERRCDNVADAAAELLAQGLVGGWFQGRSELGPRALGQRSIVADPRLANGKAILNERVKHREAFRPFAPAVMAEHSSEWFDFGDTPADSPFMLRVLPFRESVRARVPAVVHVDGTGRVQTVSRDVAPAFHSLISHFCERTGVPMLLNTSFNVMGEPIVETPADALWCMLFTGLDFCVIESRLFVKSPGYESMLDLVPRVAASRCTVELLVNSGTLTLEPNPEAEVTFTLSTPWGNTLQTFAASTLALLSFVDGVRSGREIVAALSDEGVGEPTVVASLRQLQGARILTFAGWRRGGI